MKSRIYIDAFDCVTSTAGNPGEFWEALERGVSGIKKVDISAWPLHFQNYWLEQNHKPFSCRLEKKSTLTNLLCERSENVLSSLSADSTLGIIFSSTKGAIEDYVWEKDFEGSVDPLDVVLESVVNKLSNFNFKHKQVVSNSCASSHASLALGKKWLQSGACSHVLVIAGDIIGPFIHSGFQSLKALSLESAKPFQDERDGLVLGEAFTAIVLSTTPSEFELVDCQIFNEAHTVTGASPEGRGLLECIKRLDTNGGRPDFAIAHGTATFLNDQIEDRALSEAQKIFDNPFFVTGTKWSIGHTLGASGSIDLIAAMMSLRNQKIFSLQAVGELKTPQTKNYVYKKTVEAKIQTALVTSLGFGGTNGALLVKRCENA